MPDEPRVGRKAVLFAFLGIVMAVFFPVIGILLFILLAFAWAFLIFLWIVTKAEVRRAVVYISVFSIALIGTLWVLGKFGFSITAIISR